MLADWFDSEQWQHQGRGEYRHPVAPEVLLDPAPGCIWPALMRCDFLPLLSNNAGDWLCVRIDERGRAEQIVQWYHGGGDWIPWGKSLAEALLFDALVDRLPGSSRRHAEPAEDPRPPSQRKDRDDPLLDWACEHLPDRARDIRNTSPPSDTVAADLVEAGLAEVAIRCGWVVEQLTQPQRSRIQTLLGKRVDPKTLAEWLFDIDRMPQSTRTWLQHQGVECRQVRWDEAAEQAERVTKLAPELGWAWDICGYAAERRNDSAAAIEAYRQAANCSVFTDQSIRMETHWASDAFAKFGVSRLNQLCPDQVEQSDYYRVLRGPDVRRRRIKVTEYWMDRASRNQDDPRQVHDCFVAAAWDVGVDSISVYAKLLEQIGDSAEGANQPSRAELARTHRRCLRERYGC